MERYFNIMDKGSLREYILDDDNNILYNLGTGNKFKIFNFQKILLINYFFTDNRIYD